MVERGLIDWEPSGAPRSRQFDDVYFSREDGLAESRAVFLAGCGLPEAWRGRDRFVVGELGFGTGLNILALLQLWSGSRTPGARLNVFSVEAHPLSAEDAARALQAWPELSDLAAPLLAHWPTSRGFHRLDFPALDATLDIAIAEAAEALDAWDGRADAWFLDGFAPARNPEMWRDEVLGLVARRSSGGARAATFTVAGAVRRGLQAQGFSVAKRAGFGAKGERLEATFEGTAAALPSHRPTICIIGAGVAGASLARAFRRQGLVPIVIDRSGPGAGASGNPAALVTPRLDVGGGGAARLHAQAFGRACAIYRGETPDAIVAEGALQLEATDRDAARFDRLAGSDLFEPGALERLTSDEAGERLGEPTGSSALWFRDGLSIEPAVALSAWLAGCQSRAVDVGGLQAADPGWRLLGMDGRIVGEADIVCIAAGFAAALLAHALPLVPVRGQASFGQADDRPAAGAWGGYVIPTRSGLLFGATHDRGDVGVDVRAGDQTRNLQLLAKRRPVLAASLGPDSLDARAGIRAATPDHGPLAGQLGPSPGLFILGGLGGRGFTLAPLLAEHVAARSLGLPSPLPEPLARAVAPDRFSARSGAQAEPAIGPKTRRRP